MSAPQNNIVKFLRGTNLDFSIRCAGVGSSSGRDYIVSMAGFDEFAFDDQREEMVVGAGMVWGIADEKMVEIAPGYADKFKIFGMIRWWLTYSRACLK